MNWFSDDDGGGKRSKPGATEFSPVMQKYPAGQFAWNDSDGRVSKATSKPMKISFKNISWLVAKEEIWKNEEEQNDELFNMTATI